MNRMRTMLVAIAVAATASLAFAQNADKNSAGPTKNDYRLRVIEPREGATVAGDVVRVVVDTRIPSEVGSEKVDVNSMPRPMIDVFLDNDNRGTLKQEQNVLEVNAVSPGPHKLVFVAKNMSNEIIGRQEVNFTATEKVAASTSTSSTTTSASTYTAPPPPAPAPAPAPAPSTSTYESKPPAPAPATTYQSTAPSTTSQSASSSTRSNRLPHTGTSDGLIAVSGLGLLAAGYALRRRQA